jgi:hypothetical protein
MDFSINLLAAQSAPSSYLFVLAGTTFTLRFHRLRFLALPIDDCISIYTKSFLEKAS